MKHTDQEKQAFFDTLDYFLQIPGESTREAGVRTAVIQMITPYVDHIETDHYGNVLAQRRYGSGYGPVLLLNAHLDTVNNIESGRDIVKQHPIWRSSRGILGADDRAGVAVLVEIAKALPHSSFNGTVKWIFTVEEEIGLQGAHQVNRYFLWDVDAAIVVDRRGDGDIVVADGAATPFCSPEYGGFIESAAVDAGLSGWKCAPGGSSDTKVWAACGIESVNLSAGYRFEHTSYEQLDVEACYRTAQLIKQVLQNQQQLAQLLQRKKLNHSM